jgi:hypothetical protein
MMYQVLTLKMRLRVSGVLAQVERVAMPSTHGQDIKTQKLFNVFILLLCTVQKSFPLLAQGT